ncbi:mannuronate-specific alginate lyase [Azotobacter beijerinckii]|uniref:Alginate lyase n=1 Tax=Azotobacter beijerinckii TaxID=170623 RepID=A0A1I4CM32_9GAMM|nr:mannuronate-specific alginate lyase [Azotobacter beijerinckii]SFB23839.1 poly(beta-D-mannuronate) lyase [Azotobacter beijerinckii]SFK82334.1 poly(beta-D-mannuronate) lyase [Azotobacter beijerinckii]
MKTRLVLPCLLGSLLLSQAIHAASALVPPKGYYAAVDRRSGEAPACPTVPAPYTGELIFRSKYEGSDSARATLNEESEKAFRTKTAPITEIERGFSRMVMRYMEKGRSGDLECALAWLDAWAEDGALLSTEYNHTGKSMRKWALGSLAGAYLRLKFSSSQPLADYPEQARRIEAWFAKVGQQVVADWSDLPLQQTNNHSYWAAWAAMAAGVATDRRDLFDWAVGQFHVAAGQVDPKGFLPNELKRRQRALAYHNYSLPPLMMIAAFAQANGVDLRGDNDGALGRLASNVLAGVEDPEPFAARAGDEDQDMEDLETDAKFSWLEPYCALYACSPALRERKAEMGPFKNFRLGGDVTRIFDPDEKSPRSTVGKRD